MNKHIKAIGSKIWSEELDEQKSYLLKAQDLGFWDEVEFRSNLIKEIKEFMEDNEYDYIERYLR